LLEKAKEFDDFMKNLQSASQQISSNANSLKPPVFAYGRTNSSVGPTPIPQIGGSFKAAMKTYFNRDKLKKRSLFFEGFLNKRTNR
jgi:hypothetical protein